MELLKKSELEIAVERLAGNFAPEASIFAQNSIFSSHSVFTPVKITAKTEWVRENADVDRDQQ